MLQPDLGTSLVFGAILAGMLLMSGREPALAGGRWRSASIAMVPIAWTYVLRDYQKARLIDFLDANPDIQGAGYQLYQAQIAVGSGGLFGKGLTNGTQTQGDFLPVQATDFVFAMLAEELGFIGGDGRVRPVRRCCSGGSSSPAGGRATRSGRCSRRASRR